MSNSRTNDATRAEIDKSKIFASGTFKNVWAGKYTEGRRKGQPCVAKEFKTGPVHEEYNFKDELNITRRTQTIIDDFDNAGILTTGCRILLNTPAVWTYEDTGHLTLVEPMIEGFEKFNSNGRWAPRTGIEWAGVMQALSHFSYHDSKRQFLLCDLQGGVYRDDYVLSDPVIMSQFQDCGPADLGPDGINSFFQRHRCGRFCNSSWMKPVVVGKAVPMRQESCFARLQTRQSRLSRLREWFDEGTYR